MTGEEYVQITLRSHQHGEPHSTEPEYVDEIRLVGPELPKKARLMGADAR